MTALDELRARITVEPGKMGGEPCIRGHRITAECVATLLARGCSESDVLLMYPSLAPLDLDAVRLWASVPLTLDEHRRVLDDFRDELVGESFAHRREVAAIDAVTAALDAALADRARLHATVAALQEMAAAKYWWAGVRRDAANLARGLGEPMTEASLEISSARAQDDAAALSRLAREALGIEEP